MTEKVLKCLTEENKDVRKGDWNSKEVNKILFRNNLTPILCDDKELQARILTQLVEEGVTPQYSFEITFSSDFFPNYSFAYALYHNTDAL